MKNKFFITLLFTLMILLSSCNGNTTVNPTSTPVDISAIQTSAVGTAFSNVTQTAVVLMTVESTPTLTPIPATMTTTITPTLSVSATPTLCDDYAFVGDTSVKDGTIMTVGQSFVKTWRILNTGSCTWGSSYKVIYGYGEKMSGVPNALASAVNPGQEVEVSVNMKAPLKSGDYMGFWRLQNSNGVPFGKFLFVSITVQ